MRYNETIRQRWLALSRRICSLQKISLCRSRYIRRVLRFHCSVSEYIINESSSNEGKFNRRFPERIRRKCPPCIIHEADQIDARQIDR